MYNKKAPSFLSATFSCLDFRPVLERHPHVPLSIHGKEIDEAAPERFVERLHRLLPFERLDESVQLLGACLSALDGRGRFFVCFLRFVVPAGEVVVAFLVGALVIMGPLSRPHSKILRVHGGILFYAAKRLKYNLSGTSYPSAS